MSLKALVWVGLSDSAALGWVLFLFVPGVLYPHYLLIPPEPRKVSGETQNMDSSEELDLAAIYYLFRTGVY
jgi:hypothetical protein